MPSLVGLVFGTKDNFKLNQVNFLMDIVAMKHNHNKQRILKNFTQDSVFREKHLMKRPVRLSHG